MEQEECARSLYQKVATAGAKSMPNECTGPPAGHSNARKKSTTGRPCIRYYCREKKVQVKTQEDKIEVEGGVV